MPTKLFFNEKRFIFAQYYARIRIKHNKKTYL